MFHPPAAIPSIAHLPLPSAVMSGPPLSPFWIRNLTFAFGTALPVPFSTMTPDRRLVPRQSSAPNRVATEHRIASAIADAFFKTSLLVVVCRLDSPMAAHKNNKPPRDITLGGS